MSGSFLRSLLCGLLFLSVPAWGFDSVPTIILDGRYRTSPSQAGSQERMLEVLDSLLAEALRAGS